MAPKSKKLVYTRRFLNKAGDYGLASVLAELSYSTYDIASNQPYLGTESRIDISDCDKIIKLALPVSNVDDIDLSIKKVQILADVFRQFEKGLVSLRAKREEFDRAYEERRKKLTKRSKT